MGNKAATWNDNEDFINVDDANERRSSKPKKSDASMTAAEKKRYSGAKATDARGLTPSERRKIYEEVKAEQKAKRDSWINSEEGMSFEPMEDRDMYEAEGQSKQPSGVFGKSKGALRDKMESIGEDLEPGYERKKEMKYKKGKVMRPIKRIDDLRKRSKEFEKYGH
jgi:hypothetical protein